MDTSDKLLKNLDGIFLPLKGVRNLMQVIYVNMKIPEISFLPSYTILNEKPIKYASVSAYRGGGGFMLVTILVNITE